jgi:hypothetical protein
MKGTKEYCLALRITAVIIGGLVVGASLFGQDTTIAADSITAFLELKVDGTIEEQERQAIFDRVAAHFKSQGFELKESAAESRVLLDVKYFHSAYQVNGKGEFRHPSYVFWIWNRNHDCLLATTELSDPSQLIIEVSEGKDGLMHIFARAIGGWYRPEKGPPVKRVALTYSNVPNERRIPGFEQTLYSSLSDKEWDFCRTEARANAVFDVHWDARDAGNIGNVKAYDLNAAFRLRSPGNSTWTLVATPAVRAPGSYTIPPGLASTMQSLWEKEFEKEGGLDRVFKELDVVQTASPMEQLNEMKAMRVWASRDGKFRTEAALVEFDGKIAKLKKTDGTDVPVALESLSVDDVRYLRRYSSLRNLGQK